MSAWKSRKRVDRPLVFQVCPWEPEQRLQYLLTVEALREATPAGKPSAEELASYEAFDPEIDQSTFYSLKRSGGSVDCEKV